MSDGASIAADLRQYDRPRYLLSLLLPVAQRPTVQAVFLFNVELTRARDIGYEPVAGALRLQWWAEQLAAPPPVGHPLLAALGPLWADPAVLAAAHDLVVLRQQEQEGLAFADDAVLVAHARRLAEGQGRLLAAAGAASLSPAVLALHTALQLVGMMRAIPFAAPLRRILLPRAALAASGLGPEQYLSGKWNEAACVAVDRILGIALGLLAEARPVPDLLTHLHGTLARRWLVQLRRAGAYPFYKTLLRPDAGLPLALTAAALAWRAGLGR